MARPHNEHWWHDGVSRRSFLKTGGASLALPWLMSLPLRAESGKQTTDNDSSKPPVRFACLYFSNGVEPAHWWARGRGADMHLGPGIEPLAQHREELVILDGLFNAGCREPEAHLGRMPNLLSGAWVSLDQNDIRVGRSMDQVSLSNGRLTSPPSLVLGIRADRAAARRRPVDDLRSCISGRAPSKPATKEIYPARAFDQIVGGQGQRKLDRSILDQVLTDAKSLRTQLSKSDRVKLDEYLESIRSIEQRIDRASKEERLEGWRPTLATPDMPRPADELPQEIPDHMRLILDLIVLAFQMDKTRIATCMLNNDLSQMNFGFLEGVQGSLHLDLTHNGRDPELEAMYLQTNRFHIGQFAYLIDRLKKIDEGGQSLLHNSLLMCCSNLFDGDKHQADRLPIVLAGQAGGSLKTGRILNYLDRPEDERRACSLYLSVMDRMGVSLPQFATPTGCWRTCSQSTRIPH